MNVSGVPRSRRSIGLSSRPAATTVAPSATTSTSGWSASTAITGSSVAVVEFAGESDMGVLLIRCLESELYAEVVVLSIIVGYQVGKMSFDALCAHTCTPANKWVPAQLASQTRRRRKRIGSRRDLRLAPPDR